MYKRQRITNVALRKIGAVGNFAVTQLISDLFFRSYFGLHFLRRVLGTGTFNDETTNTVSQDVEPLLRLDRGKLSGASVGHWAEGSRFLATTGMEETPYSSRTSGKGFVVMNQATTYTEDRTPREAWEGVWVPANGALVHKFESGPNDIEGDGFIASKVDELVFGEFTTKHTGQEDGQLIPWCVVSAAFAFSGLNTRSAIKSGVLDLVFDETTQDVEVLVRTDTCKEFRPWSRLDVQTKGRKTAALALGQPHKDVREFTWAQFLIRGRGYFEINNFTVDAVSTTEKAYAKTKGVSVVQADLDYFNL